MSREITDDERRAINLIEARRWLETRVEPKDYAARLQEIVASLKDEKSSQIPVFMEDET